jgi:hypothetical protein
MRSEVFISFLLGGISHLLGKGFAFGCPCFVSFKPLVSSVAHGLILSLDAFDCPKGRRAEGFQKWTRMIFAPPHDHFPAQPADQFIRHAIRNASKFSYDCIIRSRY